MILNRISKVNKQKLTDNTAQYKHMKKHVNVVDKFIPGQVGKTQKHLQHQGSVLGVVRITEANGGNQTLHIIEQ